MVYVDLNPIRAGIAATPEESEFTSIQARIRELKEAGEWAGAAAKAAEKAEEAEEAEEADVVEVPLLRFRDEVAEPQPAIPFGLSEYLELVDWSARVIRGDKRGAMDDRLPPLLQRLNIDRDAWRKLLRPGGNVFSRAIGKLDRLTLYARALGKRYLKGQRQAECLYGI
jgi:hypothetical protein